MLGGSKPLHVLKSGVQLSSTHFVQAALSPNMHFDIHFEAVQWIVAPKQPEHVSE